MKSLITFILLLGIGINPFNFYGEKKALKINILESKIIKATINELVNCEFYAAEGYSIDKFTVVINCKDGLTYYAVIENVKFTDKIIECIKYQKKRNLIVVKNIEIRNLETNETEFIMGHIILKVKR